MKIGKLLSASFVAGALVVTACVGDPPVLGNFATKNCTSCGGSADCIDLSVSPANCGACGKACATGQVCSGGTCQTTCASPFTTCGDRCADLTNDAKNCGACGRVCPNGVCADGQCQAGACPKDKGDCDGFPDNGCETPLDTAANCGACGAACARLNATGSCVSGACKLDVCSPGFLDCDGKLDTGCEVDALNDPAHCGNCSNTCPTGFACVTGICAAASPQSFVSPSSPTGLLVVPRSINVTIATVVNNGTLAYTTNGSDPTGGALLVSPYQPSPPLPTGQNNGDTTVLRWVSGTESPRALVIKHDDAVKTQNSFIVENFKFATNNSPVIGASKGASLSATATLNVWSSNGLTRVQVVYAVDGTPVGCLTDAAAVGYTGNTSTPNIPITAPQTAGLHKVQAALFALADCNAAKAATFPTSSALDIGTIIVQ